MRPLRASAIRYAVMAKTQLTSVMRRISIVFELDNAIECIRAALERIAQGRYVLRADPPVLFLLANGLERYLKVSVHLLYYPNGFQPGLKSLGHSPLKAEAEIFRSESPNARVTLRGKEDLEFAQTDPLLRALLECIDAFAVTERYFLLDGAGGELVDVERDPRELWETVLSYASDRKPELYTDADRARAVVAPRLIGRIQRYLRCIAQAVHDSTTGDANAFGVAMNVHLTLRDDQLEVLARR